MLEPNHDDLAIWLLNNENRQYVKDQLGIKLKSPHIPFWANDIVTFVHEYYYKPAYEAPEYYDALQNISFEKESNRLQAQILWEIKPELNDLGDTLRQMRRYNKHTNSSVLIILFAKSRFTIQQLTDYFKPTGIYIFQFNASHESEQTCSSLSEKGTAKP